MENGEINKDKDKDKPKENNENVNIPVENKGKYDKGKLNIDDQQKIEEIENKYENVKDIIEGLYGTVKNVLENQYTKYVETFNKFMDDKRKDLKEKMEKMEKDQRIEAKKYDAKIIIPERDFFKKEAIRLNQLCQIMSEKIEELSSKMKTLTDDLNTMTTKWKESENINKQLFVELERNTQSNKELEKENLDLKERLNNLNMQISNDNQNHIHNIIDENLISSNSNSTRNIDYNNNENINNENENNLNYEKIKDVNGRLAFLYEKLKVDLKKERLLNHKLNSQINKENSERNKLERIFSDCVEEARKEIASRRLKETINSEVGYMAKKGMIKSASATFSLPIVGEFKNDKFSSKDKKNIIEAFLEKDEVINEIQKLIFTRPKNDIDQILKLQGVNILNENRVNSPPMIKSGIGFSNFERLNQTKNTIVKGFTYSGGFGKNKFNFKSIGRLKNLQNSNY